MVERLTAQRRGIVAAATMFAAVALACAVVGPAALPEVSLLFVAPLAMVGLATGALGGACSAAVAALVVAGTWWAGPGVAGHERPFGALGLVVHIFVLAVTGLAPGFAADERRRRQAADSRWFEMSNDMLVEADLEGYFTRLSDRWEECMGWTKQELMSRPFKEFIHPDDLAATLVRAESLDRSPGEVVNFENRYLAKDGSWHWLLWCARSDHQRKYAVARDITDRKLLEQERKELLERVEAMARTDSLTGLPNRRAWDEQVVRAMSAAHRSGAPLALAIADLDFFKDYNDANGHSAGDRLLVEAARSWSQELRTSDFLARYGGEEFAVLLPGCGRAAAAALLERFRAATPGAQTCSVGVAFWDWQQSAEELVAAADAAMYRAKRAGRDRVELAGQPAPPVPAGRVMGVGPSAAEPEALALGATEVSCSSR